MARKPRIHFPNAFYHVILRGNGKQDIFFDDQDRYRFPFVAGRSGAIPEHNDGRSNKATSAAVVVSVANDTTPPAVSITSPVAAAKAGGTVMVAAAATANIGITKVVFYVDGVWKSADTTAPFTFAWNTKTATNAAHTLTAMAYDAAGNMTTSAAVGVMV